MPNPAVERSVDAGATLWFRILIGEGAFGPGKVDLMRRIAETGSVSAAARSMGMSHARSVKLVAELNALGAGPLVETRIGGDTGGGARLTPRGKTVLARYEALEAEIETLAAPHLAWLAEALHHG
jgi:molybdate transport system regulatory protein